MAEIVAGIVTEIVAVFGAGEAKRRFVAGAAAHRDTARGQSLPARPGVAWLAALPSRMTEARDTTSPVLAKSGNIVTRAGCACQRHPGAGRVDAQSGWRGGEDGSRTVQTALQGDQAYISQGLGREPRFAPHQLANVKRNPSMFPTA